MITREAKAGDERLRRTGGRGRKERRVSQLAS
jgi:hypothetical protein